MQRISTAARAVCAASAMLLMLCGCAATSMKGTPFFSGEQASTGDPKDRVNIWPLVYYREPALSVLWPIGEYSDTRLAVRPLFSLSTSAPDTPYDTLRILWPLSEIELSSGGDGYFFPFYWWDDGSFAAFPFVWHLKNPWFNYKRDVDSLFPLFVYSRGGRRGNTNYKSLSLLWPLINRTADGADHSWRAWPLAGYGVERGGAENHAFWLAHLGGFYNEGADRGKWFIPFYHWSQSGDGRRGLLTPFWTDSRYASRRTRSVPPLLSWQSRDSATGASDFYALAGLYHNRVGIESQSRSWLFPFYYSDDEKFISPLWAHSNNPEGGRKLSVIPPLLSWRSRDPATGASSLYALGGLFSARSGGGDSDDDGASRSWMLPFYFRDRGLFFSPLWAHSNFAGGERKLSVIPPLLSWQSRDPDTGASSTYALGGIFHARNSGADEAARRSWLLPFYYSDHDTFATPLWAHYDEPDGGRVFSAIPPLLSWQRRDSAAKTDSLYLLGGLFHRRAADGDPAPNRDWLFPLYYRDRERFLSPLWARANAGGGGRELNVVPPLLAWQSRDPATGASSLYAFGGIFHARGSGDANGDAEAARRSWLLPFYYSDAGAFISPFWAHSNANASGGGRDGERILSVFPPLLSWQSRDLNAQYASLYALGGLFHRRRRDAIEGVASRGANALDRDWLLPLYYRDRETLSTPLFRLQKPSDPDDARRDFSLLLGLFHQRWGVPPEARKGRFLPFYAYDNASGGDSYFLTPLFGNWSNARAGENARYYFTPLVGSHRSSGSRRVWAFPFYEREISRNGRHYWLNQGQQEELLERVRLMLADAPTNAPTSIAAAATNDIPTLALTDAPPNPRAKPEPYAPPSAATRATARALLPPALFDYDPAAAFSETRIILAVSSRERMFNTPFKNGGRHAFSDTSERGIPILWSASSETRVLFDPDITAVDDYRSLEQRSLLWRLYDYRHEEGVLDDSPHDYTRRRILWRVAHYERLNGDISLDIFPAITWDKKSSGGKKFAFLWRLFRYETAPGADTKLDILFIPILR